MENKKNNNALEKAEKVTDKNGSTAPVSKKMDKAKNKNSNTTKEQKKASAKMDAKAEREKILANKRIEKARIRAHKKAEKEKAKAAALREKNRRKAQIKERKMQLKAEKQARKDMLKNESKVERERRLALERTARLDAKKEKRARKAGLKAERMKEESRRREQRERARERRKERHHGYGGWLAAVISLGLSTLILASVLTFTFMMPSENDAMLESTYRKSFYNTVEQVDNIDLNLSKALSTNDVSALEKYLINTAINSELAENELNQLPLQDESKFYTAKLINQIGDYSKYLYTKLIDGQALNESDYKGLEQLYKANLTFKQSLMKTVEEMGNDFSMSSLMDGGEGNVVINNFNELQNLSVEYPELIYDGPFSDGQDDRELKGLKGEEIDQDQALEIFINTFSTFSLSEIRNVGVTSGVLECFNVEAQVDGDILFAQITKIGGKVIMFAYSGSCRDSVVSEETAKTTATEFLSNLGIDNVKPVWINLSGNVYTINLAYEKENVIVYSDLIKVRVCAETGMVIGLEAKSYYTNHTDRVIEKPKLDETTASNYVSGNIEINSSRLVLVPIGTQSEKLCYEFSGEYDGSTYYVYIDAMTGKQVEMFKVIETTEGTLLM